MKKLNDFIKEYGDYIVKDGFMDFLEKPRPKTVWDLKDGDVYFYIDLMGYVCHVNWDNGQYDNVTRNLGNAFLTLEEAEFEKKRREVYATVKLYAYEFSDDEWNNFNMYKYYPFYDYTYCCIATNSNNIHRDSKLYFKSEKDIEKAIEAVGEEYFKKYYLGVKKV